MRTRLPLLLLAASLVAAALAADEPAVTTAAAPASRCGHRQFPCHDGSCIAEDMVCDGVADCSTNEDEARDHCERWKLHGSPEAEAAPAAPTHHCQTDELMCHDLSSCVPLKWVCDGEPDCADGSDESHCGTERIRDSTEFIEQLRTHMQERRENANYAAEHGLNASSEAAEKQAAEEVGKMEAQLSAVINFDEALCDDRHFMCRGGGCINQTLACDGKEDCPFGDDESSQCHECAIKTCAHKCTDTPAGGVCSCERGYEEVGDACEDMDECALVAEGRRCSHHCENLPGSYVCSCEMGYELASDRHTCRLRTLEQATFFVGLSSEIRAMELDRNGEPLHGDDVYADLSSLGQVKGLAYFHQEDKLFAAVEKSSHDGVIVLVKRGEVRVLLENVGGVAHVAVDWLGGNLYFTSAKGAAPGIYVCKANGMFCRRIVDGVSGEAAKRQSYRGLAVNPRSGRMAWIDSRDGLGTVHIADLDGSNVESVSARKIGYATSPAFDIVKNELYLIDADAKRMEKINLDTNEKTVVLSSGVHGAFQMIHFNGYVYWTDWGAQSVRAESLEVHPSPPTLMHKYPYFPHGIAINHTAVQPAAFGNPCESLRCPWLCVVVPRASSASSFADLLTAANHREGWSATEWEDRVQARCLCPEGYTTNADYDAQDEKSNACVVDEPVLAAILNGTATASPHLSAESMEGYCNARSACSHHGACAAHKNAWGRVVRLTCKCSTGFSGAACEVAPDHGADAHAHDADDEDAGSVRGNRHLLPSQRDEESSGGAGWGTLLVLLILVAAVAVLLYYKRQSPGRITNMTRSTMHRVAEARLPERAAAALKQAKRAAATNGVMTSSAYTARPAGAPSVAAGSGARGAATVTQTVSAPLSAFSNPAFGGV